MNGIEILNRMKAELGHTDRLRWAAGPEEIQRLREEEEQMEQHYDSVEALKYDTPHGRRCRGVTSRTRFNGGRSSIVWAYSHINAAWFVWREDGGHQALIRVHNDFESAQDDYFNRVRFVEAMEY